MKTRKTNAEKERQGKPSSYPRDTKPTLTPDHVAELSTGPTLGETATDPRNPVTEPDITPSELAHIATQLSLSHEKGLKPRQCLSEAHQLIRDSASYLENASKHQKTYTFNEILEKGLNLGASKGKRAKTPVEGIATRDGLIKAIRREFGSPESELIILRGCITEYEIACLKERLANRRSANARGSRKRRHDSNET